MPIIHLLLFNYFPILLDIYQKVFCDLELCLGLIVKPQFQFLIYYIGRN